MVALFALWLARRAPARAAVPPAEARLARAGRRRVAVYLAIALSGASALGAEVVWTRVLSLLLGATVYTFSILLAVFLTGIAFGSWAGSRAARGRNPAMALGLCQLALVAAIAWTAFMLGRSVPFWPVNPLLSASPWLTFQIDLARALWSLLPAAVLWGASFPLALGAAAAPGEDPSRLVGRIYAANTVGAIVGALAFSLVLIPWIGTQGAQRVLLALAAAGAAGHAGAGSPAGDVGDRPRRGGAGDRAAGGMGGAGSGRADRLWPAHHGRSRPVATILYAGEGINSSIAISRADDGAAAVPRQRQGRGVHLPDRHAAAAHARPHAGAVPSEPASRC